MMPSSKKMLPNARKKVTASARARVSVRKIRKDSAQLDGSYLGKNDSKKAGTVSTLNSADQIPTSSAPSQDDAIMSMLYEIKESNASLARRLDKVEQASTKDATPLNPRSHMHNFPSHSSQMGSPQLLTSNADHGAQIRDPLHIPDQRQDQVQFFNPPPHPRITAGFSATTGSCARPAADQATPIISSRQA